MRIILGLVLSIIFATGASAQWVYQEKQASAFSNETVHLLIAIKQGKGLSLRCQNGESELMFVLTSKIDELDTVNALQPKLLVRIDNNQTHELSAVAQNTGGRFLLITNVDTALIEEIRDAKRRVAVVIDLMGNKFAETSYSARGSTSATKTLLQNCQPAG